jgi:hypothetical protein
MGHFRNHADSHRIAEAFGCQVDLNRATPCMIGGKDYGQTFYDLGFPIGYSYLSLPAGIVNVVKRRRPRSVDATDQNA